MEWYKIKNTHNILSPTLVLYPNRISHNIDKMIEISGDVSRLRPHVKTYKMPQIVQMQMARGINKFKCSTLSEARMLANAGVMDILLAMPTIGPAQVSFIQLKREYSRVQFSTLIDSETQIAPWIEKMGDDQSLDLFIDVNVGMNRTGIIPEKAFFLFEKLKKEQRFAAKGLHVYDGHIRTSDFKKRIEECDNSFRKVNELLTQMNDDSNLEVICGGSITFPCHALYPDRTLSPGTTLLWDAGYGSNFPDIPMLNAAALITRIISKPGTDRICIDLGHKAVGSEMEGARVVFPQLKSYERVGHSEEHLVLKIPNSNELKIGDVLYGIPWHICPTVALYQQAAIVRDNEVIDIWEVAARHRDIQVEG